MSANKKLVFITSRFPYPLTKGDKLRAYYQIRDLSKYFDIYLICTTDENISEESRYALSKFCKEMHFFKLKKWRIFLSLSINSLISKPFQVAYFYDFSIKKKIDKLLASIRPNHIFSQLIRSSEYVKNYHACPKTLDYMDALSKGMERRYKFGNPFLKWLYNIESKRLKVYETKIFDYFENQLMISEQDRNFILHPDYLKIHIVPNGIDDSFFENIKADQKFDVGFVGNLNYEPNILATEYLYHKLHAQLPSLKFLISGANPASKLLQFNSENFVVQGYVSDIRSAYGQIKIFVAPMFIGTGLQNKILEAMAQGVPCITTTMVNNAIGAREGEEILLAETSEEFVLQIQNLLADCKLYENIRTRAEIFVRENFSWTKINSILISILDKESK